MNEKARYIALTDVNPGPEIDDIQSLLRLLLYSNEIDIEGLIACTSCFLKKPDMQKNIGLIRRCIDGYAEALAHLRVHAGNWPDAAALDKVVAAGIPVFGKAEGDGFAEERWNENDGVKLLLNAMQKDDPRPLWIGLWGGANTLAQALWLAERRMEAPAFFAILHKLRIYSISDQDYAGKWLRKKYGDALFYIVSPSDGDVKGAGEYYKAAWPGISADRFPHGSEDGVRRTKGFSGADFSLIDKRWIRKNVRTVSSYGKLYPRTKYITEGDTPAFLGLIPNGLNLSERPDCGGWGGRYEKRPVPGEPFPVWTSCSDTVTGADGRSHTSPQATVWRWRTAFQNDFAARLKWTTDNPLCDAPHPPVVTTERIEMTISPGTDALLTAQVLDPDEKGYDAKWFYYPEAGTVLSDELRPIRADGLTARLEMPPCAGEIHVILEVTTKNDPPVTRYVRFILTAEEAK